MLEVKEIRVAPPVEPLARQLARATGVHPLVAEKWVRGGAVGDADCLLGATTLELGLEAQVSACWRKGRKS